MHTRQGKTGNSKIYELAAVFVYVIFPAVRGILLFYWAHFYSIRSYRKQCKEISSVEFN